MGGGLRRALHVDLNFGPEAKGEYGVLLDVGLNLWAGDCGAFLGPAHVDLNLWARECRGLHLCVDFYRERGTTGTTGDYRGLQGSLHVDFNFLREEEGGLLDPC